MRLPAALRDRIAAEAQHAFPRECCGLLEGRREGGEIVVTAVHAARNLSDRTDRFEIAPDDHLAIQRAARGRGNAVVGCYHSHPNGRAEPSRHDQGGASEAGYAWLIAAAESDGRAEIAAYLFDGTVFLPLTLSGLGSLDPAASSRV